MIGDLGNKLLSEAKRARGLDYLAPYAGEMVNAMLHECQLHEREFKRLFDAIHESQAENADAAVNAGLVCLLLVHRNAIRRNKRILLAYCKVRQDKITHWAWGGGDDKMDRAIDTALTSEEQDYRNRYTDLLAAYRSRWTDIDLTGTLEPPDEIFVDVRVLKDAGEIETEYGTLTLTRNSQLYVRQSDVGRLISQGYLERV